MSRHGEFFHEIPKIISANGPCPIAEWFTEDFTLHDPNRGAGIAVDKFRELGPAVHFGRDRRRPRRRELGISLAKEWP